jgi:Fe-S cluster assembly iron-binding protein IscA
MLAVTNQAAAVIRDLTTQPDLPPGTGVRISSGTMSSTMSSTMSGSASTEQPELNLTLSSGPAEGDTVMDAGGARIFADQTAVQVLDGKTLDAQSDGRGGVEFAIVPTA